MEENIFILIIDVSNMDGSHTPLNILAKRFHFKMFKKEASFWFRWCEESKGTKSGLLLALQIERLD